MSKEPSLNNTLLVFLSIAILSYCVYGDPVDSTKNNQTLNDDLTKNAQNGTYKIPKNYTIAEGQKDTRKLNTTENSDNTTHQINVAKPDDSILQKNLGKDQVLYAEGERVLYNNFDQKKWQKEPYRNKIDPPKLNQISRRKRESQNLNSCVSPMLPDDSANKKQKNERRTNGFVNAHGPYILPDDFVVNWGQNEEKNDNRKQDKDENVQKEFVNGHGPYLLPEDFILNWGENEFVKHKQNVGSKGNTDKQNGPQEVFLNGQEIFILTDRFENKQNGEDKDEFVNNLFWLPADGPGNERKSRQNNGRGPYLLPQGFVINQEQNGFVNGRRPYLLPAQNGFANGRRPYVLMGNYAGNQRQSRQFQPADMTSLNSHRPYLIPGGFVIDEENNDFVNGHRPYLLPNGYENGFVNGKRPYLIPTGFGINEEESGFINGKRPYLLPSGFERNEGLDGFGNGKRPYVLPTRFEINEGENSFANGKRPYPLPSGFKIYEGQDGFVNGKKPYLLPVGFEIKEGDNGKRPYLFPSSFESNYDQNEKNAYMLADVFHQ